jgi:hypothetical protein
MAPTNNVHVPWQFHGQPETYALAVRLYLTDLAKRLVSARGDKDPIVIITEDMREIGLLPPE